jgi:hypothetical protein
MLEPDPNPVPKPECIPVPVPLRQKVAVPVPQAQTVIGYQALIFNYKRYLVCDVTKTFYFRTERISATFYF